MSRAIVTALFALFTVATAHGAVLAVGEVRDEAGVASGAVASYWVLKLAIVAAFTFFIARRPRSRRPSRDPVAIAACVTAILAVVLVEPPGTGTDTALVIAGNLLTLASCAFLLASVLALGRCFGVLPEVRGLVTRGPYRLVRHPVYLGEIGALAGWVLAAPTVRNAVAGTAVVCAQAVRMRLEERALTAEFPEYAEYAARTPRFFPRPALAPSTRVARQEAA
jgi:protein-S-isoprenylcysteine O-methyltransferase Ste14